MSKSTLILIIILNVAVIAGVVYYFSAAKHTSAATAEAVEPMEEGTEAPKEDVIVVDKSKTEIFKLGKKMQINIISEAGSNFILVAEVGLEISNKKTLEEMMKFEPKIADVVNTILSGKTYEELTVKDRDRSLLKNDIKAKINDFLNNGKVIDVLFQTFVFQPI
jgi:flagellar basal body-associated protein FliL